MNRLKLGLSLAALACGGVALAAVAEEHHMGGMGGDRVVTRAEAQTGAEALFTRFDLNHDGKLDASDRAAHLGKMFDSIDTNHDGAISRDEFAAAHGPDGAGPAMGPQAMEHGGPGMAGPGGPGKMMHMRAMGLAMAIMHEADPQRTGAVSHDGFIAAALRLFDKADANHDGKVTPEERQAAHAMMGRREHGGMDGMGGMHGMDHDDMPAAGH